MSDADDLFEYAKDPHVGPNAGWAPHRTRSDSEMLIRKFQSEYFYWAMVLPGEGKVIGGINLTTDLKRLFPNSRSIGYSMSPDYWGMGYMTEAAKAVLQYGFQILELDVISAYHYPENTRSKRVIQKCGFTYEGTLRMSSQLFNNKILDNCCYSMTKQEYNKLYKDLD